MKFCDNCRAAAMNWCDDDNRRKCLQTNLTLWLPAKGYCKCGRPGAERYSLGIYAGFFCDECWRKSGFREDGPPGFDPMDAGEDY